MVKFSTPRKTLAERPKFRWPLDRVFLISATSWGTPNARVLWGAAYSNILKIEPTLIKRPQKTILVLIQIVKRHFGSIGAKLNLKSRFRSMEHEFGCGMAVVKSSETRLKMTFSKWPRDAGRDPFKACKLYFIYSLCIRQYWRFSSRSSTEIDFQFRLATILPDGSATTLKRTKM